MCPNLLNSARPHPAHKVQSEGSGMQSPECRTTLGYDIRARVLGNSAREARRHTTYRVVDTTAERAGAIFAILTPGVPMDIDAWLGDMASALEVLELDKLFRHRDGLSADSDNWKATADGYVDGYHLGFLHRNSIGAKSITNRNTYDLFGPHVRLGFANKPILTMRELPDDEWRLREAMSLVHYIFPNVSISGLPGSGTDVQPHLPRRHTQALHGRAVSITSASRWSRTSRLQRPMPSATLTTTQSRKATRTSPPSCRSPLHLVRSPRRDHPIRPERAGQSEPHRWVDTRSSTATTQRSPEQ